MNADLFYDPTFGLQEWSADMECSECGQETEHDFARIHGATTAICGLCEAVTDIDPDDFED